MGLARDASLPSAPLRTVRGLCTQPGFPHEDAAHHDETSGHSSERALSLGLCHGCAWRTGETSIVCFVFFQHTTVRCCSSQTSHFPSYDHSTCRHRGSVYFDIPSPSYYWLVYTECRNFFILVFFSTIVCFCKFLQVFLQIYHNNIFLLPFLHVFIERRRLL